MRRENDWEWVQIKVYPEDRETIEKACGYGSLANRAEWMVQELAHEIRSDRIKAEIAELELT